MMAENPNWWSLNDMRPQYLPRSSFLSPSPPVFPSQYVSGSSSLPLNSLADHDTQNFPQSWSQLLLGGLASEEDGFGTSPFRHLKLENWEDHIMNPPIRVPVVDVKREAARSSQLYGHKDDEFQASRHSWSSKVMPVSSPRSCITSSNSNVLDFSSKKADGKSRNQHPDHSSECNSTVLGGLSKKARVQTSSAQPSLKVRKEKLGDRITALHQLVSPFGKTDTASVLLEAIGYIRFLQGQIEALSSPYLGTVSGSMRHQQSFLNDNCLKRRGASVLDDGDRPKDLRSRGLCLIPVSCTHHVIIGGDIGADYWASALGGGF
ncbi:unnamed protein product [Ilex paraguariensis]|uniref:BHLH domain-containing protein n=1 Tax=Ilex paraguariensis TaxID=185542 RepID=A0ABC8TYJ2_9AQUA